MSHTLTHSLVASFIKNVAQVDANILLAFWTLGTTRYLSWSLRPSIEIHLIQYKSTISHLPANVSIVTFAFVKNNIIWNLKLYFYDSISHVSVAPMQLLLHPILHTFPSSWYPRRPGMHQYQNWNRSVSVEVLGLVSRYWWDACFSETINLEYFLEYYRIFSRVWALLYV